MSTELFERCRKEGRVKVAPPPPGKVGAFIFEDQLHDFIQQSVDSQDDLTKLTLANRKYPL